MAEKVPEEDEKSREDPLKEALEEVAKSEVNKRKIIISATEDNEDDPERKKPHLSSSTDDDLHDRDVCENSSPEWRGIEMLNH